MENIMQELRQKLFVEPKGALSYPKNNTRAQQSGSRFEKERLSVA